jgi:hypothetical protein
MNNTPARIPIHPETRNETTQSPVKSFIQPTNIKMYICIEINEKVLIKTPNIADHNRNATLIDEKVWTPGYIRVEIGCLRGMSIPNAVYNDSYIMHLHHRVYCLKISTSSFIIPRPLEMKI